MVPLMGPRTKTATTVRNASYLQCSANRMPGPTQPCGCLDYLMISELDFSLFPPGSFILVYSTEKKKREKIKSLYQRGYALNEKVGALKDVQ